MSDTSLAAWGGRALLIAALAVGVSAPIWATATFSGDVASAETATAETATAETATAETATAETATAKAAPSASETAPAAAARSGPDFSDERVFGAAVRKYLMENPEVIVAALQAYEARQRAEQELAAAAAVAKNIKLIENDGYSFVGGNPDGDVTLVEFVDYNCGYCKRAHEEVAALVADDPNIRYVIKEFPILSPPSSRYAAAAALASLAQQDGKLYKPFHDKLMTHRGVLSEEDVRAIAAEVGLDVEKLTADLAKQQSKIAATYQLAQAIGIQGTPAFVIGGKLIGGAVPRTELAAAVAEARAKAAQ